MRTLAQAIYQTCGRKNKYRTMAIASQVATERGKVIGHKLYFYHCRHCRFWHLTKQEPDFVLLEAA